MLFKRMCISLYIFSRLGSKHHVQTPWLQAPCANICWLACCNMIYNHNNNNNNTKNNNIYIYIYIYIQISTGNPLVADNE